MFNKTYLNDSYPLTLSKDEIGPLESTLNCVGLIIHQETDELKRFPSMSA